MFVVLVIAFLVLLTLWVTFNLSHWKRRGVPGPTPWPIAGNVAQHLLGKKTLAATINDIYNKYANHPFVGIFRGSNPCLLVRDPELANRVLVTDFKSFRHNEFVIDKKVDPLIGHNPFFLRDQEWKDVRQMLTPGMTSGKMKHIFPVLEEVTGHLIKFIENHPTAVTDGIETRALTKRATLDYVAKAAFGIDGKAFESYDNISEFNGIANQFFQPGNFYAVLFAIALIFPVIMKLMSLKMIKPEVEVKLTRIISDVVHYRKKNNIKTSDYLQFIIEQSKTKNFGNVEITSHACTFFVDGYETSSSALSFLLLHLTLNPEYQEKIRDEIKKYEQQNNGKLTYEALHEMPWLNACFYESLRKSPPFEILFKQCSEHYEYTPTNKKFKNITVKLAPGDAVLVPVGLIANDETYFENADKFIPERMFQREMFERATFLPFGDGPRICIGQRFGVMQVKLAAAHILKNFNLSISPKLKQPITYMPYNLLNEVEGGVWIRFKKIE